MRKNDPELVAYARELRDRWQEQIADGGAWSGMLENKQRGRYAVARLLGGPGAGSAGDSKGASAKLRIVMSEEDGELARSEETPDMKRLDAA